VNRFDSLLQIMRQALESGHAVEIDGLGTFQRSPSGYEFVPQASPQVFIAYVEEDRELARRLCESLRNEGCSPWLDKERLSPGQNWPKAIERAIEVSDAFVACFSPRSVYKYGQFQCELRLALECARKRPLDATYLIPVRLEECAVPRRISDQLQYVDLFPDWRKGVRKIARAVRRAARSRPLLSLDG
jgi:hypothetical protein